MPNDDDDDDDENPSSESRVVHADGQRNRHDELIVAFRNFVKA